ncbi:MAG: hypothetical protein K0B37_02835 [Bacteroidales bacterium]|nr:hypothetical protein [Bacteroidales bacterium]
MEQQIGYSRFGLVLACMNIESKKRSENLPVSHVHPKNGELLWLPDDKAAKIINK